MFDQSNRESLVDCLLTMAEVEWEHERYFRSKVLSHRWARRLPVWPEPPPRETIRSAFNQDPKRPSEFPVVAATTESFSG